MSYGIQIKNTFGEIQIDSTYKNWVLHEQGSWAPSSSVSTQSFASASPTPVSVAIRPPSDYALVYSVIKSGSSFTGVRIRCANGGGFTINYKVFREPQSTDLPTDYGAIVNDDLGNPVFWSSNRWMKAIGSYSFSDPGGSGNSITQGVTDANNYMILVPEVVYIDYIPTPPTFFAHSAGLKYASSTSVRIGGFRWYGASGNLRGTNSPLTMFLTEVSS